MTYTETQRQAGLLTIAPAGTTCQGATPYSGSSFGCHGAKDAAGEYTAAPAVHTWTVDGVEGHYCGYHSPFDVTAEDREAIAQRDKDEEFEAILTLTHEVGEARRAIDLPAGDQAMQERPARVIAWKQAQEALAQAFEALSDQRLADYAEYRRRAL